MVENSDDKELRRLRNLVYFKDKTDEEILQTMAKSKGKKSAPAPKPDKTYEQKFKEKLKTLQDEFAVDMNDANDREMLNSLVRHMLQSEQVDESIRTIHQKDFLDRRDFMNLKDLGEFQGSVNRTISDLQEKLGISRKQRKEKSSDDIPLWMDSILEKAESFFEDATTAVSCAKCKINLVEYWKNFPKLKNVIKMELECWKCHEITIFNDLPEGVTV